MTTDTYEAAPAIRKTFYADHDDIMFDVDNKTSGCSEDMDIKLSMTAWYGDPMCREVTLSATYMGVTILLECSNGWRAV